MTINVLLIVDVDFDFCSNKWLLYNCPFVSLAILTSWSSVMSGLRLRSDISAICHLVQYIWHFPHKHTKIYFALNCVNRNKWHFIQYFLYCPNSAKSEGSIPSMANSDASGSSDFCLVSAIVCWYTGWAVVG